MILSNINPLILFVNPSLGTQRYTDEDKLRSYLSLGTLASALRNRAFLKRFAERLGRKEIIADSEGDYPVFDIVVLNLSLKPGRQSIQEYFSDFLTQFKQTPLMVCMTATSAHLDEPLLFETRWVMSYLAGPLTRDQIRTLMADARPAPGRASCLSGAEQPG